jgi:hypothetical protein
VKVARLLGAGRIVATGRDDDQLREVQALGADAVINTALPDESLAQAYLDAKGDGYDVVLESLRTSGVEIYGAAKGLSPQTMREVYSQVVTWTRSGDLTFDVVKVPLSDIETAWQRSDLRGSRLVVVP